MFKKKNDMSSNWEQLVAKLIHGAMVHVDMLFVPKQVSVLRPEHEHIPRMQTMRELFSTFVGEHFCGFVPKGWLERSNETHALLLIPLQDDKWDRARQYVSQLCAKKTPYNYSDLPMCSVSNTMVNTLLSDVTTIPTPRTVFCSQAALLTLRHAFDDTPTKLYLLSSINSRGCSPVSLYNMLQGMQDTIRVDVDMYVKHNTLEEWNGGTPHKKTECNDDGVWISKSTTDV